MSQDSAKSNLDYRVLFERVQGLYLVLGTDPKFTILEASDEYLRATMTQRDVIVGRGLFDVFPDNPNDPTATGEKNLAASLNRVIATHKPHTMAVQKYDIRRPESEGGGFEERFWTPMNSPVLDAQGNIRFIVHRAEDVTDLVRMQRDQAEAQLAVDELRESEARLRELADAMPQIVWTARADGSIDYLNERWYQITQFPREHPLGRAWLPYVHPEDVTRSVEAWTRSVQSGEPFECELRLQDPKIKGGYCWYLARALPVRNLAGQIVRWYGTCTDIDSSKRLEAELHQAREVAEAANRAKDQFLAMLSHELRTPLTPVLLTVSLLERVEHLPNEVQDDIQTIRRNVELEARLIDDLLDLTRITRGALQLHFETVDINILIRNATELCCRERVGDVELHLDAEQHHVRADPARMQQVFWNVLSNADKFTPSNERISVVTRNAPNGHIIVEVSDQGVGIEPEILPTVFNAFQQGDASLTRNFGGLGLGLTISRRLIEAHHGTIEASSAGRMKGATFTIDLPTVTSAEDKPVAPDKLPPARSQSPMRILLVEDHVGTLMAMTKLLTGLGHHVITAASVKDALAAAEQGPIDLVISDLGLPDGSGHDVMRALRSRYAVRGIAVSGFGMDDDITRSHDAGFEKHLTKPVDLERLQAAIQQTTK